MLDRNR